MLQPVQGGSAGPQRPNRRKIELVTFVARAVGIWPVIAVGGVGS